MAVPPPRSCALLDHLWGSPRACLRLRSPGAQVDTREWGERAPDPRPLPAPVAPSEHPCLAALLCWWQQDRLVFFGLGTWRSRSTLSCLEAHLSLEQSHSLPTRCWRLQKVVPDPVLVAWTEWRRGGSAAGAGGWLLALWMGASSPAAWPRSEQMVHPCKASLLQDTQV